MSKLPISLIFSAAMITFTACACGNAVAFGTDAEREGLRGIGPIMVVIQSFPDWIPQSILTEDQLRAMIEKELREAGVRISANFETGQAGFYVSLDGMKEQQLCNMPLYHYSSLVRLIQRVRVLSTDKITRGATWADGERGSDRTLESGVTSMRQSVEDSVKAFLQDYRAANSP
jgi:hypothetical protein